MNVRISTRDEDYALRFIERIPVGDGCWEWPGASVTGDYGRVRVSPTSLMIASRYSYTLFVGPIPDGLLACHHCDNPPCVRPSHLFLGTHSDNALDMVRKGRHRRHSTRAATRRVWPKGEYRTLEEWAAVLGLRRPSLRSRQVRLTRADALSLSRWQHSRRDAAQRTERTP